MKKTGIILLTAAACFFMVSCASVVKKISVVKATDEEQVIRDQVEETPVPTPSAVTAAPAEESKISEYTVQKGDSLWKISRTYYWCILLRRKCLEKTSRNRSTHLRITLPGSGIGGFSKKCLTSAAGRFR